MSDPLVIPAPLDGERIDRAVALLTGRSRSEVSELITAGRIRLGGEVVVVRHRRVLDGETLEIDLPPSLLASAAMPAPSSAVPFRIVYVDDDIIVVDKPAGVVVHPGAGHRDDTLVSGLLDAFPDLATAGAGELLRPGIVHRLDKDTSGLLVVARTSDAYRSLVDQLAERSVGRVYSALCRGVLDADLGTIDAPIGRSARHPTRMAVRSEGRSARTTYRVERRYAEPTALSLLEVSLETGRTHQIRVHLSAIGHAVAGDRRYGGTVRELGLARPFLHARSLRLRHPRSGEALEFTAALPNDLVEVLDRCR